MCLCLLWMVCKYYMWMLHVCDLVSVCVCLCVNLFQTVHFYQGQEKVGWLWMYVCMWLSRTFPESIEKEPCVHTLLKEQAMTSFTLTYRFSPTLCFSVSVWCTLLFVLFPMELCVFNKPRSVFSTPAMACLQNDTILKPSSTQTRLCLHFCKFLFTPHYVFYWQVFCLQGILTQPEDHLVCINALCGPEDCTLLFSFHKPSLFSTLGASYRRPSFCCNDVLYILVCVYFTDTIPRQTSPALLTLRRTFASNSRARCRAM